MKKTISTILLVVLACGVLSGCGNGKDADTNTLFVDKTGHIVEVSVGDFDKENYDQEEFEKFVEDAIDAYEGEGTVELDSVSVEDKTAKLNMEYSDSATYTAFVGKELFAGTIVAAVAEGYDFNVEFTAVEKGELKDAADRDDVLANDEYKVVILEMSEDVSVDGKIAYVSEGVILKDESTATVQATDDLDEDALHYVVYQ